MPLHPQLVHLPLALSLLVPLFAISALLCWWRGWTGRRLWGLVVALQALLVLGSLPALQTGDSEEERVEHLVPHEAVETHEDAANLFFWVALGALALQLAALVGRRERAARALAIAATVATLTVALLALRTGHLGAELVYRHGAFRAYTEPADPGGDRR